MFFRRRYGYRRWGRPRYYGSGCGCGGLGLSLLVSAIATLLANLFIRRY